MAKRLSSLFSSKDSDLPRSAGSNTLNPSYAPSQTPPKGKLTKPIPAELDSQSYSGSNFPPPPIFTNTGMSARPVSREGARPPFRTDTPGSRQSSSSRPQTPTMLKVPGTESPKEQSPTTGKLNKRRSWLPGKSDRQANEYIPDMPSCQAWIAGLREKLPYDLTNLLDGQPVEDLWDEQGDVLVYLYPEGSRKGPSFRVNSQLFADSMVLSYLTQPIQNNASSELPSINLDATDMMQSLSLQDQPYSSEAQKEYARPTYSTMAQNQVKSVHLPLGLEGNFTVPGVTPQGDDMELVVVYRNFFAFLCGGALVATHRQNTLFSIFMSISSILRRLQYGNDKGSSWGGVPWASFARYTDELRLADVRSSREKTIEAILLGYAMKSWPLYCEGFTHAVGKLDDIKAIRSPKFDRIPPNIVNKLERAAHNLASSRLIPLHAKLDSFYFPSMFSGIANSQTATESKLVSFKSWKMHFMDFRQYTMAQYKKRYGNWPPKAKSKKNNFEESGLNRLLIREVYKDFTDLYELLVDRASLTPRTVDMPTIPDDAESGSTASIQHALRSVESEYDRATPPVSPPIPFDVPLIPSFQKLMLAKEAQLAKKLKDLELTEILLQSYNGDKVTQSSWIQEFMDYEYKLCAGKSISEIVDIRCGQWLFIYAVLQALPMTVVDARDLAYTEGVEYFLCEPPRGGRPWMQSDVSQSRAWYNVASGGGMVSLPADMIDHSVEGIYRRSHCWIVATTWAEALGPLSPVQPMPNVFQQPAPGSLAPTGFLAPSAGSTSPYHSPYHSPLLQPAVPGLEEPAGLPRISSRTSMNLGLQEVAPPVQPTAPASQYKKDVTFDNIFASQQIQQKVAKKKK